MRGHARLNETDRKFAWRAVSTITRTTAQTLTRPTVEALRAALPAALARALEAALAAVPTHVEVWAVGGAVRDLVLGRAIVDLDLATSGDPGPLAEAAAVALAGTVEGYPQFGTASAVGEAGRLDFARLRRESYSRPGALPVPEFDATIEEDLARRDFSVNAIALGVAGVRQGEVVDPLGGLADLQARRLRVLHAGSFEDDATRIWRGARYAARLGLRAEPQTLAQIREGARGLAGISGERIWAEFERTAAEPVPGRVLALLEGWGALEASAPGLRLHPTAARVLRRRRGPLDVAVLFAVVTAPLDEREAICERLAAPREAARAAHAAATLIGLPRLGPEELATCEGASDAALQAARWLDPVRQRGVLRALRRWERTRPLLNAADLEGLGVPVGPALGEWLRRLRAAHYLGTLRTAAAARRAVREALDGAPAQAQKESR